MSAEVAENEQFSTSFEFNKDDYPMLHSYASPLKPANRKIIGRREQVKQLLAAMERPELCNAILTAPAGSGKTALVQAAMLVDTGRIYLEVDLSKMISNLNNADEMAVRLKELFEEVERFGNQTHKQIVLFIDEFHQVVQLSPVAVEALKPLLALSGTRGTRVIMATTYDEFHQFIAPNQPLVERLQRINLPQTDKRTTLAILKGMAERYGVADKISHQIYELIYEYTERYQPASSQPRKSILVLDGMIGWHRFLQEPMDKKMLAEVIHNMLNVNVDFRIDASKIEEELNKAVFDQAVAANAIARRMQVCIAGLNDKTRPIASLLFAGSSGVGKTEMVKQLTKLLFDDPNRLIRFDMSEYALDSSLPAFKSELSSRVWNYGHAIILIDEIEKASDKVRKLLLQVLDDGRLTDDQDRQVSFLNTYIVMTTNAGSEIFHSIAPYLSVNGSGENVNNANDDGDQDDIRPATKLQSMADFDKVIRRSLTKQGNSEVGLPPELLGRIDTIVAFYPLSEATKYKILERQLNKMRELLRTSHGVSVEISDDIIPYIMLERGDTNEETAGGARGLIATLNKEVITEVATFINLNPGKKHIRVFIEGNMRINDKELLHGNARVVVESV